MTLGRIYYLPIEAYQSRYTADLARWTISAFRRNGLDVHEVKGQPLDSGTPATIQTGVALDAHGRSYYALSQMAGLIRQLRLRTPTPYDVIYLADMFTPGYEALPYVLAQAIGDDETQWPKIFAWCHAQSVDQYDFTHSMRHWMRHYEWMVSLSADGILVSDESLADLLRIGLVDVAQIYEVGHVFNSEDIRNQAAANRPILPWRDRTRRVIFASRFDVEKQPHFFMDLIEATTDDRRFNGVEFAIATGEAELRSNSPTAIERLQRLMGHDERVVVWRNLSRRDYLELMADSRVHFNCSLQDFVSYTLLEASALGTPSLLPAFRSFPAQVSNRRFQLYVPWSIDDALEQLALRLTVPLPPEVIDQPARKHDSTTDRILEAFRDATE